MRTCTCDGSGYKINGHTGDVQRCACNVPIFDYSILYVPEFDEFETQDERRSDLFSTISNSICSALELESHMRSR